MTELPETISAYLGAHGRRDAVAVAAVLADDVVVVDDGHTYRGVEAVKDWVRSAAGEYTYTSRLMSVTREEDGRYDALHRLEGNFPGGVVDLHYRFTLRGGKVARLEIAA
ncbi:nuclear transport factor 2 family protein [Dactylosporangium sp. CA-233914]|uniref:nuclear transport factor 2 family protein n=1 Tax=Dactylosporangium sp. CA-233914 TaxID=3239934 RepID=UPI003D8E1B08